MDFAFAADFKMASLPSSVYCTSGRRAFGNAGLLPDDDEWAGLQVATHARTEWGELVLPRGV